MIKNIYKCRYDLTRAGLPVISLFVRSFGMLLFPIRINNESRYDCSKNNETDKSYSNFIHNLPPLSIIYPKNTKNKNAAKPMVKITHEIFSGVTTLPIKTTVKTICAKLKKNFVTFSLRRFVNFINIIPSSKNFVNYNIADQLRKFCEDLKKRIIASPPLAGEDIKI